MKNTLKTVAVRTGKFVHNHKTAIAVLATFGVSTLMFASFLRFQFELFGEFLGENDLTVEAYQAWLAGLE